MRKSLSSVLLALFIILFSYGAVCAQQTFASQGPVREYRNYFVLKGGIFDPQGDLRDLDTGFNGELAYGVQLGRYGALEIGSGYFELGDTAKASFGGSSFSLDGDMYVIPMTLTLKAILPLGRLDLYGLAGGGGYYVHAKGSVTTRFGRRSGSADTGVAGGFLGAGMVYNFTRAFFLGLEGKYLWTSEADFDVHAAGDRVDANLTIEGVQGTVNLGFRF